MKDEKIDYVAEDLDTTMSALEEETAKSISSDDALLMSMGKKPELRRVYNFWTCTCLCDGVLCYRVPFVTESALCYSEFCYSQCY
jgi:hypothetical protein